MPGTIHLLTNPAARGSAGPTGIDAVVREFETRGQEVVEVSGDTPGDTERAAADVVAGGAERLVVLGGDGMVHIAVQAVAETRTILGILPLGTGNDFAGGLGLPTDLSAAVQAALGSPKAIDLMRVGPRWAASVATVGFSAAVNARANSMRWPRGASRYTLATVLELPRLATQVYELTIDGKTHEVPATLITIANTGDFGGGMRISPSADPTDGVLEVTVVGNAGRFELLRWFRNVFDGTHLDHSKVSTLRGSHITITSPDTQVWADGEPIGDTPINIEAVPGALQLAGL